MKFDEEKLIETIKPYFASARAGDWEHSLRVVKWVKELGKNRDDLDMLVTAAYIHDIGWSGIAPKGKIDFDEMLKLELKAAENSSFMISKVLNVLQFSESEIEHINRLVAAADKHESKKDDEAIIVDADNIRKLCLEHLQEKYQPESFAKLINRWDEELPERIKTQRGKELLPKLLIDLKQKVLQL
jgi:HD superfamily phosphodiesterase